MQGILESRMKLKIGKWVYHGSSKDCVRGCVNFALQHQDFSFASCLVSLFVVKKWQMQTSGVQKCWYSLASWKRAAMASSHHWESRVMKGSSIRPRRKISWPAVRATVAIRLHARIMSNCTWGTRSRAVSFCCTVIPMHQSDMHKLSLFLNLHDSRYCASEWSSATSLSSISRQRCPLCQVRLANRTSAFPSLVLEWKFLNGAYFRESTDSWWSLVTDCSNCCIAIDASYSMKYVSKRKSKKYIIKIIIYQLLLFTVICQNIYTSGKEVMRIK